MKKFIVDSHAHCLHDFGTGKGEFLIKWYEREHTGRALLKTCERKFPQDNTLVALTGVSVLEGETSITTDYCVYEGFVNSILHNLVYKGKINDSNYDTFVSLNLNSIKRIIARAQEVSTPQGHILLLFADRNTKLRNLEDVLKEAKNETNAIVISDHTLYLTDYAIQNIPFPYNLLYKALKGKGDKMSEGGRLSLGTEYLEKYSSFIDAVEIVNGNCPELENLTKKLVEDINKNSKKLKKEKGIYPIKSSDCHSQRKLFSTYAIMYNIDDSNPDRLRESYRRALASPETKLISGKNGFFEIFMHVFIDAYNQKRLKKGWLKREQIEIIE